MIYIHGGPAAQYGNTLFHEFQVLASHGFMVLYTNPRGSLGREETFAKCIEGNWGDLTFMYEADPHINKIAIVAEGKWKDQLLMYLGAGRRQAAVEFFSVGEIQAARDWLQSEKQ